jgi:hypothetical protein
MTLRLSSLKCLALICGLRALAACATTSKERKYPPRRPGCHLTVSYATAPFGNWDDIGVAQVGCYLDEGEGPCLHRLKAEACRMGGDVLYAVPNKAARPGEREMTMRGRVAHTRAEAASKPEEAAPAPSNEPVVPLGTPARAPTPPSTPAPPPPSTPAPAGPADAGGGAAAAAHGDAGG